MRREGKAMARLRDGPDSRGTDDTARAVASHPASPPQDDAGARCAATGTRTTQPRRRRAGRHRHRGRGDRARGDDR